MIDMKSIEEILAEPPRVKRVLSDEELRKLTSKRVCPKCHGLGVIPGYLHVKSGKCFECNGKGKI